MGTWIVFAAALPLVQWITTLLFPVPGPVLAGDVWTRFGGTMAVAGVLAAALMYAAARLSSGWPRSILFGIVLAMAIGTDVQAFASRTPVAYGVRWIIMSVIVGLLLSFFIHLLGRANQPR